MNENLWSISLGWVTMYGPASTSKENSSEGRMESIDKKRRRTNEKGAVLSKKSRSLQRTPPAGLRVNAYQLQELWRHDNECGRKFMKGCPWRMCTDVSSANDSADRGLTNLEMSIIKTSIQEMWRQAGTMFEVFFNKDEENEGYRLRVRNDLAIKVVIRQQDAVPCGWVAEIPADLSTAHVYKRSWVDPNGYLGGPVSFMNWCPTSKQQVTVLKSISHNATHICKMWTNRNLVPGTELKWDYGCNQYMPDSGVWFKDECCSVSKIEPSDLKRHEQYDRCRKFTFQESCVLCGFKYSIANKENRIQRKQHLAGLHADFLGSEWDGTGSYDQQVVDPDTLFCKTDELNYLVGALKKMNWNVLPACKVFSREELEAFGDDEEALMDEFNRRYDLFRSGGTLVLRGIEVPSTPAHFEPIKPCPWKVITWKNNLKPPSGRYAVSSELKETFELGLPAVVSTFCEKYFDFMVV